MKDSHRKHKNRQDEEVHIHKKCKHKRDRSRDRSRSRSRENSRSRETSHDHRSKKNPHKHHSRRADEHRSNEKGHDMKIKRETSSDSNRRPSEKSANPHQNIPRSKWDSEDNDSKSDWSKGDDRPRWGKGEDKQEKKPMENKAKPDFGLSGKLAEEVNTYKGVVIKYSEPPEARMPKRRWRLYPFKGETALPTLYIHRQSAYLIGRDRVVVDLPVDHPSCSKQHAVLQYRVVSYTRENGSKGNRIRPYIIDLDSANGTYVNNQKIEPRKFVELLEKDVIKFAYSSREYVLLHEHSKDEDEDDNVILND